MVSGLRTAKVWIMGLSISAIAFICYTIFSPLQYYLGNIMIGLNAPASIQMTLNNEYNWGFLIIGVSGILIPIIWTFWKENREREY